MSSWFIIVMLRSSPNLVQAKMIAKCDKIIAHGVNVFVNRQLVYNLPEQYLADHGVMVIEHADFDGIERIARVTGTVFLASSLASRYLPLHRW